MDKNIYWDFEICIRNFTYSRNHSALLQTGYFQFNMQLDFTKWNNKKKKKHLESLRDYREVVFQLLENLYVDDSSNSFNRIKQ